MSKLEIKEEMRAIDCRDYGWYSSLSDDEKKKLNIWLLMRFTSSCSSNSSDIDDYYLEMTNELVNDHFSVLRHHPDIQHRLLQMVGIGNVQFHPWIPPSKGFKKDKISEKISEIFPEMGNDDIETLRLVNTNDEIKTLFSDFGLSKKEITELFK